MLRKYFDSVTLSLYVDLYLNDRRGEGVVKQVNDWLGGKNALPEYKVMNAYVANSRRLEPVIGMLLKKDHSYRANWRKHCFRARRGVSNLRTKRRPPARPLVQAPCSNAEPTGTKWTYCLAIKVE